jgi:hypothetical protein
MTHDIDAARVEALVEASVLVPLGPTRRERIDGRITAAIAAEQERRSRRRRPGLRRPVALAVGLLLAAGMVTVVGAATNVIRMEWGSLPEQQRTPAQINAEIEAAMRTTPVPPGYTFPPLHAPEDGSVWGSFSGQSMVEFSAVCGWYGDWTAAFAAGDAARIAADTAMLDQILTWKTFADRNLSDESVRDLFRSLNASVRAGDPEPVRAWLQTCSP